MVTGKETFTKRAANIPECAGYNGGVIVKRKEAGKSEIVKRAGAVVYEGEDLIGGWAHALRKGWQEPVEIEVSLKEYRRFSAKGEPTKSWREMPATMIRKVALVQALREAFPNRYAGMYSPEEMPIDDSKLDGKPIPVVETEVKPVPIVEVVDELETARRKLYPRLQEFTDTQKEYLTLAISKATSHEGINLLERLIDTLNLSCFTDDNINQALTVLANIKSVKELKELVTEYAMRADAEKGYADGSE